MLTTLYARAAEGLPPNPAGHSLANVSIILCTVAGVLVLCRLLTRIFVNRSVGWDDHTLIASLALAIGMTVCFNMEVYYGMGLHTKQVKDKATKVLAFKWLWIAQLLYKFANGMTKTSIVLLYLRIFPSKRFRIVSLVLIGYVWAYCIAAICTSIWQCDPIEKAWKKTLPGKCIDIGILWYVNSVNTLVADLLLICLPMNHIWKLKLPLSQKVGLVFVFSLGVFVMACTIIRCVALGPTVSQEDSLFYQAKSNSWTFLEVDVSIICAALPVLKAPLAKLFPNFWANKTTTHGSGNPNSRTHKGSQGAHSIGMTNRNEWRNISEHKNTRDDAASDEEEILGYKDIRKTMSISVDYEMGSPRTPLSAGKNGRAFDFAPQR